MADALATLKILLGVDASGVTKGTDEAKRAVGGFSTGAKAAFGVAGAAATLGFGLMAKGSQEMERAQGNFQAATGASREEAIKFSKDMNGLVGTAGTVGRSFEEIADTGTMVEQQFGTTGDKTRDLTADILEFSKVTKQDATTAAADLEDTLSSYGLTADDAAGFMDKLVASNQEFGTNVGPEALATMRNMAPALQAIGGDADDAVGFLNLFEDAGVDAGAAATALGKSIKGLKPGQTVDDLIAQVGAIEDPLERAQKAAEIFGLKAGPKMAAAIKPGMTSLEDYTIDAEGLGDVTHQAAEDMLTSGDKIRMFAEKAGAKLRELGQAFGPAISGLGGLATGFGTMASQLKLGDFVKNLTGKLSGAISSAWTGAQAAAARVVQLAGQAAAAAYQAAMKLGGMIADALGAAWDAAKNVARSAIQVAAGAAATIYKGALALGSMVADALGTAWDAAKSVARSAIQAAAAAAGFVYQGALALGSAIADTLGTAWDAAKSVAHRAITAAAGVAATVYQGALKLADKIGGALGSAWDAAKSVGRRAITAAGAAAGLVYAGALKVGHAIGDAIGTAWDLAKNAGRRAIQIAGAAAGAAYGLAVKVGDTIATAVTTAWNGIQKVASGALGTAIRVAGFAAGAAYAAAIEVGHKVIHGLSLIWEEAVHSPVIHTAIGKAAAAGMVTYNAVLNGGAALLSFTESGGAAGKAFGIGFWAAAIFAIPAIAADFGNKLYQGIDSFFGNNALENSPGLQSIRQQTAEAMGNAGTEAGEAGGEATVHSYEETVADELHKAFPEEFPTLAAAEGAVAGEEGGEAFLGAWKRVEVSPGQFDWIREAAVPAATEGGEGGGEAFGDGFGEAAKKTLAQRIAETEAYIRGPLNDVLAEIHKRAAWGGAQTAGEFSQGLRDNFDAVKSGFQELRDVMKNTLSPAAQEAEVIGILTSRRLAKGLNDERPEVRAQAQQVALDGIAQLHRLDAESPKIGHEAMELLASATEEEKPAIRDALKAILGVTDEQLDILIAHAGAAGTDAGADLAAKLDKQARDVWAAAQRIVDRTNTIFKNIDTSVTVNVLADYGRGLAGPGGKNRQHGGPIERGELYIVGEEGPELFIADRPGWIAPRAHPRDVEMSGGRGHRGEGDTYHLHFNAPIYGGPAGLDELIREIQRRLRFTSRGGRLSSSGLGA